MYLKLLIQIAFIIFNLPCNLKTVQSKYNSRRLIPCTFLCMLQGFYSRTCSYIFTGEMEELKIIFMQAQHIKNAEILFQSYDTYY